MHPATERWWLLRHNLEWHFCLRLCLQHRLLQHSKSNNLPTLGGPCTISPGTDSLVDSEDWLSMTAAWCHDLFKIHHIRSSDRVLWTSRQTSEYYEQSINNIIYGAPACKSPECLQNPMSMENLPQSCCKIKLSTSVLCIRGLPLPFIPLQLMHSKY